MRTFGTLGLVACLTAAGIASAASPSRYDEAAPLPRSFAAASSLYYENDDAPPAPRRVPPAATALPAKPSVRTSTVAAPAEEAKPLPKPAAPAAPAAPKAPAAASAAGEVWSEARTLSGPPAGGDSYAPAACGCARCNGDPCQSGCRKCLGGLPCEEDPCGPWTLPQLKALKCRDITVGGWIEQGVSLADVRAADRYNGVIAFNDRERDYQLNQVYTYIKRDVKTDGCGIDVGGRADVVFGSDSRFLQAQGLETNWQQTGLNQLAIPQFYVDVAFNDWTARVGRFYTLLGYEVVTAPDNFFYSHAYTFVYGEPFTHTGVLLTRKLSDSLSVSGGIQRGNDQFEDLDGFNALDFIGSVNWTGPNEMLSYAFGITASEQGPDNSTWIYSMVAKLKLSDKTTYVLQHDYGMATNVPDPSGWPVVGSWYGLNQYLLHQINPCWGAGLRFEWFRDNNGGRVTGIGVGNTDHGENFQGNFFELTAGLNYKPNANFVLRPELRWDWYNADTPGLPHPFTDGTRDHQLTAAMDLIITY